VLLEPASELPVRTMNVTCWEWAGTARDEGDEAAEWLSEYLGKPVRLVRYMGAGPGVSSRVGPGLPRLLPVSLLGAGGGMQTMWAYSRCCRRAGQLQLRARLAQPAALRLEACLREFLVYRSAMPTRACTPTSSASEVSSATRLQARTLASRCVELLAISTELWQQGSVAGWTACTPMCARTTLKDTSTRGESR
jgi:hypothetical protein